MDLFTVDAIYRHGDRLAFSLSCEYDRARRLEMVEDRLKTIGYIYEKNLTDTGAVLLVVDPKRRFRIPLRNIVLFALTVMSIYLVPVLVRSNLEWRLFVQNLSAGAGIRSHRTGEHSASSRDGALPRRASPQHCHLMAIFHSGAQSLWYVRRGNQIEIAVLESPRSPRTGCRRANRRLGGGLRLSCVRTDPITGLSR